MKKPPIKKIDRIKSFFESGYPDYFRRDVHILLSYGYKSIRAEIHCNTEEPTITVRMKEAIYKGLNTIGLLPDKLQKKPYSVSAEPAKIKVKDTKNIKDEYIYFDIVFEEATKTIPRRRYIVEAKKLKTGDFTIGKYSGEHGIMRFVDEVYASVYPEAVMIGFWQNKDVDYWFDELSRTLKKDKTKNKICFGGKPERYEVIPDISDEWFTIHKRKSGSKILLFHILFECL